MEALFEMSTLENCNSGREADHTINLPGKGGGTQISILHPSAGFSPPGEGKGTHFPLAGHALAMTGQCIWDTEDLYLLFQGEDKSLQNSLKVGREKTN